MAIINTRMNVKKSTGYDVHHLETNDNVVLCGDGTKNLKTVIGDINSQIINKAYKNSVGVSISDFKRIGAESSDNERFKRAIASIKILENNDIGWGSNMVTPFIIEQGNYLITQDVLIPNTFIMLGVGKPTISGNLANDIFKTEYMNYLEVEGIIFKNCNRALNIVNVNEDNSQVFIRKCQFHNTLDYSIRTWATTDDNHQSTQIIVEKCKFMNVNGVMFNMADNCIFRDCWFYIDRETLKTDRAVFVNGVEQANLVIEHCMGVPTMGTGAQRIEKVRWVDNYGHFRAYKTRFGGEDNGIPIVYQFNGNDNILYPYHPNFKTSVVIRDSALSGGESIVSDNKRVDSSIVRLIGKIPPIIILEGNSYVMSIPYITTNGFNINDYLLSYKGNMSTYFKINIENNADINTIVGEPYNIKPYPTELKKIVMENENNPYRFRTENFICKTIGNGKAYFHLNIGKEPIDDFSIGKIQIFGSVENATQVNVITVSDSVKYIEFYHVSLASANEIHLGTIECIY